MKIYRRYFKRILDVIVSGIALMILSPLIIIVGLFIRIKLGSPILFTQERPGKDEQIFKMYKFRTMTDKIDEFGDLLPDEDRLTKFGRLLRASSLDELPELWNIIKGDMSIIGPRPLLVKYLPYYSKVERERHSVRPGLTGLSQVNGRNNLNWEKRFELDIHYVKNISFINDLKILFITIKKVLTRSDIQSGEELIMRDLDEERKS